MPKPNKGHRKANKRRRMSRGSRFDKTMRALHFYALNGGLIGYEDELVTLGDINCAFGQKLNTKKQLVDFGLKLGVVRFIQKVKDCSWEEKVPFIARPAFLRTPEWKSLRQEVLGKLGCRCCKCGYHNDLYKSRFHIDHVVPRLLDPTRALDPTNLQVLCGRCNKDKGNTIADYRTEAQKSALKTIPKRETPERYFQI